MDDQRDDRPHVDGRVKFDRSLSRAGVVSDDLRKDFGVLLNFEILLGNLTLFQLLRRQLFLHRIIKTALIIIHRGKQIYRKDITILGLLLGE